MSSRDTDIVKAFIEAINRRDLEQLFDLMTENHTFVDAAGNRVRGRQEMIQGWADYFRMFPDYEIKIDNILSDEECVAVFGSAAGTYNGKRGLAPENRIEMPAAWRARVKRGKIERWQVYADWTKGTKIIDEDGGRAGRPSPPSRTSDR